MKKFIKEMIFKWTGYDQVQWLENSLPGQTPDQFLMRSAKHFKVEATLHGSLVRPTPGTVFICTHHTGAVDILAIYPFLRDGVRDLKIVVNQKLMALKTLVNIFIPVLPPSYSHDNDQGRQQMMEHLQRGGNLLLYPAGRVARKRGHTVTDEHWRYGGAALIQQHAQRVVPILVDAQNSDFFYWIRGFFPRLSLLFILRALIHRPSQEIRVYFGEPIPIQEFSGMSPVEMMQVLRVKTYQLKENL